MPEIAESEDCDPEIENEDDSQTQTQPQTDDANDDDYETLNGDIDDDDSYYYYDDYSTKSLSSGKVPLQRNLGGSSRKQNIAKALQGVAKMLEQIRIESMAARMKTAHKRLQKSYADSLVFSKL